MTSTRLSPLFVLYIEVVPTTSISIEFKLFLLLYTLFQQVMSPDSASKSTKSTSDFES
jgi:hypothetical protein